MDDYNGIHDLINQIDEPNLSGCRALLFEFTEIMKSGYGSSAAHHSWEGGYIDHITEAMNIAKKLYETLSSLRRLPFSLSDVYLILFLHDLEKPWKYYKDLSTGKLTKSLQFKSETLKESKALSRDFRLNLIQKFNIELNETQMNALTYIEGENGDYRPGKRTMNELAAFCHMCDIASARIWYDKGEEGKW